MLCRAIDRVIVPRPDTARVGWLKQWAYAHRGLHDATVPENTLEAFAAAIEAGLGIECDIQRSADGEAMVFHDWDLDRLTEEPGPFGARDSSALEAIRYRGKTFGISRLSQLLELVHGRVPLLIEIKSKRGYDINQSCAAVRDSLESYTGKHAVMSFDPRVARWFRKNSPETIAGLVMREDEHGYTQKAWQRRLALWIARPEFLAYHVAALANPMVADLRECGLPILTWTVNSAETLEKARRLADAPIAEADGIPKITQ